MELDEVLVNLGKNLESEGWEPEGGVPTLFSEGEEDPRGKWIFRARLFLRSIESSLRKGICNPAGGVRPEINVGIELKSFSGAILEQYGMSQTLSDPLYDVLIKLNLELFCLSRS